MEFKKNQIVELYIDDIGNEGEGIGHIDGYALFLKDAVIGDKVRAKIIKTKKNYGFARVEEVIEASKDRVSPRCSKARQCGGCTLQHLAYEKQLEYKFNRSLGWKNHFTIETKLSFQSDMTKKGILSRDFMQEGRIILLIAHTV